jgi:hypothetical protein
MKKMLLALVEKQPDAAAGIAHVCLSGGLTAMPKVSHFLRCCSISMPFRYAISTLTLRNRFAIALESNDNRPMALRSRFNHTAIVQWLCDYL